MKRNSSLISESESETWISESESRKKEIQACVDWTYETLFPFVVVPKVRCFGSRAQNMFTETSDWDFAVAVSEEQVGKADDIRNVIQQKLVGDQMVKNFFATRDQAGKSTLVWKRDGDKVTTSLLVSSKSSMAMALATREFLRKFYRTHDYMRKSVLEIAEMLRTQKHMTTGSATDFSRGRAEKVIR